MEGPVGWGWFSAVRFELTNAVLLAPGSAFLLVLVLLLTPESFAALVGTGLGVLSGVVFGRLTGRFIVEGLTARGEVIRRWTDPTPAAALLTLAPVVLLSAAWLMALVGLSVYGDLFGLILGAAMFFCWQGAANAFETLIALSRFERTSGRKVQQRMAWTAFRYKTQETRAREDLPLPAAKDVQIRKGPRTGRRMRFSTHRGRHAMRSADPLLITNAAGPSWPA